MRLALPPAARSLTPRDLLPGAHQVHLWRKQRGLQVRLRQHTEQEALPPPPVAEHPHFQARLRQFEDRCARGEAFNGRAWAGQHLWQTPAGLVLECAPARYGHLLATGQCYEQGLLRPQWPHEPLWPYASVGVNTCVISDEGLVLMGQRSDKMSKWPGAWFVEFGEGIGPGDEGDMRDCALRCLHEELGLPLPLLKANRDRVQLWAFGIESTYLGWSGFAVADFRRAGTAFCAKALLEGKTSAHDGWEACELHALPVDALSARLAGKPQVPSTWLALGLVQEALSLKPGLR